MNIFYRLFIVLIMSWSIQVAFAQTDKIEILLVKKAGLGPFRGGVRPVNYDSSLTAKNFPKNIDEHIIEYVDFKYFNAETSMVSEFRIHFLVGVKNDSIVVVTDTNNNLDFSDDDIWAYPKTIDTSKSLYVVNVPIPSSRDSFWFQPYPYPMKSFKYHSEKQQRYYLLIKSFEHKIGFLPGSNLQIDLINNFPDPYIVYPDAVEITLKGSHNESKKYKLGNNFVIGSSRFLINGINPSGDILTLFRADTSINQKGYDEGLSIDRINIFTLNKKNSFIPAAKGFTLLDFWGTWCKPCLELTPYLKSIHKKYLGKLTIVGIANDTEEKILKYVKKNQMCWEQHVESDKLTVSDTSLIKAFQINEYPTFVLIDENGKIIIRGSTKEVLEKIDLYLEKL